MGDRCCDTAEKRSYSEGMPRPVQRAQALDSRARNGMGTAAANRSTEGAPPARGPRPSAPSAAHSLGDVPITAPSSTGPQRDGDGSSRPLGAGGFLSEFVAGIGGYLRANVVGDPPAGYEYSSPVRQGFEEGLQGDDIPPIIRRQLRNQNYVQDRFGNELPAQAASAMLDGARQVSAASDEGVLARAAAHSSYLLDTIEPFEDGGSSWAPRALHSAGVLWQTPGFALRPSQSTRQPRSILERARSMVGLDEDAHE